VIQTMKVTSKGKPPMKSRTALMINLACLTVGSTLLWQCKPHTESSIQTLDDAATGSTDINTANLCGADRPSQTKLPDYITALSTSKAIVNMTNNTAARDAVLTTLAVVPKGLLQLFFVVGNGQIIIGGGSETCASTPFTKTERAIFGANAKVPSCWIGPTSSLPLRLVLDADPKLIRFSLLRLLAYVQAEYFITRLQSPDLPAPLSTPEWKTYATSFAASRDRLANGFLADMKAAGNTKVVEMAQHFATDPVRFGNMVYANAVDSFYCSATTHRTFQSSFANTWKVYTDPADAQSPLAYLGPAAN